MSERIKNLEISRGLLDKAIRNLPLDQADRDILVSALETGMKQIANRHMHDSQSQPVSEPIVPAKADPNEVSEEEISREAKKIENLWDYIVSKGKQNLTKEEAERLLKKYNVRSFNIKGEFFWIGDMSERGVGFAQMQRGRFDFIDHYDVQDPYVLKGKLIFKDNDYGLTSVDIDSSLIAEFDEFNKLKEKKRERYLYPEEQKELKKRLEKKLSESLRDLNFSRVHPSIDRFREVLGLYLISQEENPDQYM